VALLLGFIPGVGAMYNGQFLKGFIHVMIFVLLIIAAGHSGPFDWVFGIMIPLFVFYMAFEAYKTAEAKRLGLPSPDPLGLDRLFGLQENHHNTQPAEPASSIPSASGLAAVPVSATHAHGDHVPVGAIVLIGLGVLILLANLTDLNVHRLWPVALIAVGLWLAYKRLATGPRETR
jgi:hypothetical protein